MLVNLANIFSKFISKASRTLRKAVFGHLFHLTLYSLVILWNTSLFHRNFSQSKTLSLPLWTEHGQSRNNWRFFFWYKSETYFPSNCICYPDSGLDSPEEWSFLWSRVLCWKAVALQKSGKKAFPERLSFATSHLSGNSSYKCFILSQLIFFFFCHFNEQLLWRKHLLLYVFI